MSSQFEKNNSELQKNSLKERIKLLMTPEDLEKPYRFATRVGLSKGTWTGIWVEGRNSIQLKTAQKLGAVTGANISWIMTGEGHPFSNDRATEEEIKIVEEKYSNHDLFHALKTCYESTEKALSDSYSTIDPSLKSKFIINFLNILISGKESYSAEMLELAIFSVEVGLEGGRQEMSLEDKLKLILTTYEAYDNNKDLMKKFKIVMGKDNKPTRGYSGD